MPSFTIEETALPSNKPSRQNKSKTHSHKKLVIPVLALAVLLIGAVVGAYIMSSNHVPVVVNPQATLSLSANVTSAVVGDAVRLTAVISDGSNSPVLFYDGQTLLGSVGSVGGTAVLDYALSEAKTYDFVASSIHQ
jgi:hypothetical protein